MQLYWLEAQQKCETLGGYLAEPKTAWYVWLKIMTTPSQGCKLTVLAGGLAEV
jgi:hypothetical protein